MCSEKGAVRLGLCQPALPLVPDPRSVGCSPPATPKSGQCARFASTVTDGAAPASVCPTHQADGTSQAPPWAPDASREDAVQSGALPPPSTAGTGAPLPAGLTRPVLPPGVHPPPQPAFLGRRIMLSEQRLRLRLRQRLRLWLQLGRELEAWGRRVAAAGGRRVEAVVQQPVHGGRGALGGSRGLQGRALVLRAAVAHARDRRGGARAPAQAASLEVTVGRPPAFRSILGLALRQPRRRGRGLAAGALLPSSRRRPHVFGELGPARRACCSRPRRVGIARRCGNLRGPRPGSPPPPHPKAEPLQLRLPRLPDLSPPLSMPSPTRHRHRRVSTCGMKFSGFAKRR